MTRQVRAVSATSAKTDGGLLAALQASFTFDGTPPCFLDGLSENEKRLVALDSKVIRLRRGEILFRQGTLHNGIFVIRTGRVRTFFVSPSGRELTLAYWPPHHFVGAPEVFGNGNHQWSGMAVVETEVLHLEAARLKKMAADMPGLAMALIEGLVFKCRRFSSLVQMLGTQSASARLAHVLLNLSDVHGRPPSRMAGNGEILITQAVSHDQLASMIGVTRQWVSAMLSCWCEQNILRKEGRRIVVTDPMKLAAQCRD